MLDDNTIRYRGQDITITSDGTNYYRIKYNGSQSLIPESPDTNSLYQIAKRKVDKMQANEDLQALRKEYKGYSDDLAVVRRRYRQYEREINLRNEAIKNNRFYSGMLLRAEIISEAFNDKLEEYGLGRKDLSDEMRSRLYREIIAEEFSDPYLTDNPDAPPSGW